VGCGRVAAKADLIRLAAVAPGETPGDGRAHALVRVDVTRRLPGRGAYLCRANAGGHPRAECLSRALARKAFARAFRRPVDLPVELVESVG
jgi:predicted RNA-binding protein YlxR (DUF448 family)